MRAARSFDGGFARNRLAFTPSHNAPLGTRPVHTSLPPTNSAQGCLGVPQERPSAPGCALVQIPSLQSACCGRDAVGSNNGETTGRLLMQQRMAEGPNRGCIREGGGGGEGGLAGTPPPPRVPLWSTIFEA